MLLLAHTQHNTHTTSSVGHVFDLGPPFLISLPHRITCNLLASALRARISAPSSFRPSIVLPPNHLQPTYPATQPRTWPRIPNPHWHPPLAPQPPHRSHRTATTPPTHPYNTFSRARTHEGKNRRSSFALGRPRTNSAISRTRYVPSPPLP